MNGRQKELMQILLANHNEAIHIQDLSNKLHCSEKTVRNDFKRIEDVLEEFSSAEIIRKPGVGVRLEVSKQERAQLFQLLLSNAQKSEEERIIEIAYQLLAGNKPVTLQWLADRYYINKAAIKKDLEAISEWLEKFQLRLVSKQRIGSSIDGAELNKRNALAKLSQLIPSMSNESNYVLDLFLPYEITTVKKALTDLQQKFSINFTDVAMESLLVHALIMIKRTRQRSPISVPDAEKKSIYQTVEVSHSKWLLNQLASVFRMTFPEDELIYYTWHLISSKKRGGASNQLLTYHTQLADIVSEIIKKLKQLILINFEADSVLMDGLTVHMHAVINRLAYGLPITNPLLSDIKKMYPYMFSMIMLALDDVKENFRLEIPEDEAAYLVLHFQASIERFQKTKETKKRVLIVCHMGIGMSHLLQAKLEQHYKELTILSCIGKNEVQEFLKDNKQVDFIISTVPLKKTAIPYIVISALLEPEDKKKLDNFFSQIKKKAIDQGGTYLSEFIDPDLVYLDVELEHRFEVVEMLANALYQKEFVDREFIHSALLRERNSATSIGGAIAIPHGSPELIKDSTIAVAILAKPIEWGDEMVSIVFMLAVANEKDNPARDVIRQIASISEQPELVRSLTEVKNKSEILRLLVK